MVAHLHNKSPLLSLRLDATLGQFWEGASDLAWRGLQDQDLL